jgi:membrane protein EpsK
MVVNVFFGAAMTGGYASAVQLSLLMEYLVMAADNTIRPVILIKYAQQDFAGLKQITSQAIKLLGWALALPVGLLCGFARPLLSLWLGPSYVYLDVLLIVIICHLSLNLSVRPLLRVQNAYNDVRSPGIATVVTGVAFLVVAVVLAKWSPLGGVGVALASAIAWTARNAIYMPIYTARIMKLRWWALFPNLISSIVGTLFVGIVSYAVAMVYVSEGWFTLGASAVCVSLAYAALVWTVGMSRADRQLAIGLLPLQILKVNEGIKSKLANFGLDI